MNTQPPDEDRYWTKEELAHWLSVPVSWVRDAITARRIPVSWVGRHARFSPEDRQEIKAMLRQPAINPVSASADVVPLRNRVSGRARIRRSA